MRQLDLLANIYYLNKRIRNIKMNVTQKLFSLNFLIQT